MIPNPELFSLAELKQKQPARKKSGKKVPKRRHVGAFADAAPRPDAGRALTVGDHKLRVGLSDAEGAPLACHTATCSSCQWTQTVFETAYEERRAWVEAFKHAGLDWSGRPTLIEPPFSEDGKGNATYLNGIDRLFGDYQGPYLVLTQNCQQSNELPNGDATEHNCIGIIFGRDDGAADDRIGLCVDQCHESLERLPRLCGGLQDNGCTELASKPDPFEVRAESEVRTESESSATPQVEAVFCPTHWAQQTQLAQKVRSAERRSAVTPEPKPLHRVARRAPTETLLPKGTQGSFELGL